MKRVKHFIKTRRILSLVILIILLLVSYFIYSKYKSTTTVTSYVLGYVQKRDIAITVTGTGQVYASKQQDIKSKASGDLVYLNTGVNGKAVKAGTLIAQIDSRDAAISLESARLNYQKLVQPADAPTLLQAQNSYNDAVQSNNTSYSTAMTNIVNSFINMSSVISGMNDMLYTKGGFLQTENLRVLGQSVLDLQSKAGISYDKAKASYDVLVTEYKTLSNTSSTSTIETFAVKTYNLVKNIAESVKKMQDCLDYITDRRNDSALATAQTTVSGWNNTISSDLSSLLSTINIISSTKISLAQQKASLDKTITGANELDIASQQLSLNQAQNTYANYFIRVPFDGVMARLSVKSTDTVSNGTVIGTIISADRVADITLNEVDVAKVKVGQKAVLTYDAIDGLTMDGTVTSVDSVGTVTQGVVNYNVEISIDSLDERVRPGMSVSASIITEIKQDVLSVPNSAVKSQGKINTISVFNPPLTVSKGITSAQSKIAPKSVNVEIGIANDMFTEIVSGLNEKDQVVVRTISGSTGNTSNSTSNTGNRNSGIFGGGGVRVPR